MFKRALAIAMITALPLCAVQKEEGFYLGAGLGGTGFADNGQVEDLNKEYRENVSFDNSSGGVIIYGGYKFNNIFSLELAYNNYGTFKLTNPSNGATFEFSPSSYGASANLGYGFLDKQLRPYLLLGLTRIDLDGWVQDDKSTALHFGFGLQYDPKSFDGFGFRLGYEGDSFSIDTGASGTTTYIKKDYAQSVGTLYIGAHYLF